MKWNSSQKTIELLIETKHRAATPKTPPEGLHENNIIFSGKTKHLINKIERVKTNIELSVGFFFNYKLIN